MRKQARQLPQPSPAASSNSAALSAALPGGVQSGQISLHLAGLARWSAPDGRGAALSVKNAALLARLALDGPQARVVLAGMLWPTVNQQQADNNLRQQVGRLRGEVGQPMVLVGKTCLLAPQVTVDLTALAQCDDDALLQTGALLAGVDAGDVATLDEWLSGARARWHALRAAELSRRADLRAEQGRLDIALALAAAAVAAQPLVEHGWRGLMRLHDLHNDRAAAVDAYWRLHSLLDEELGIRPSAETMDLLQRIELAKPTAEQWTSPKPRTLLRPPLLAGRSLAWQAMADAWQRGQPFLLVGSAGMGKSRLLGDFLDSHGGKGLVLSHGQPGDELEPYAVLGRLLQRVDQRFHPSVTPAWREELARLPPHHGGASAVPGHGPQIRRAMRALLADAIGRGLRTLALDDLQHADEASLEALCWLAADVELAPLQIALASRPGPRLMAGGLLHAWQGGSHRLVRIDLSPLDIDALGELVGSLGLALRFDAALLQRLHRHAGGHPLFTLATLQDMVAHGLEPAVQPWPQPATVQALLTQSLQALPLQTQALLRIAAVAGADLTAERAARLLGCDLQTLVAPWQALEQAQVLRGERFSHDLMQECALHLVPRGVRQALHRQWAALLAQEAPQSAARMAWHWEQGERWSEAGACWRDAAAAARLAGRIGEQITLLERAARLYLQAQQIGHSNEAWIERLDPLRLRHGGRAVLAALDALCMAGLTGLPLFRCRLARLEALLDGGEGGAWLEESDALVQEAERRAGWRAKAGALQAQALAQAGRFAQAGTAIEAAMAQVQDSQQRLDVLHARSYVHFAEGRLADAVQWQQHAVDQAEAIGDHGMAAVCEGHLAALLAAVGDVPAAYDHARRVRPAHERIDLSVNSTPGIVNHIVLGTTAAALGQFGEALQSLQAALAMAAAGAAPAAQVKSRLALAQLLLAMGRPDEALDLLRAPPEAIGIGMQMQVHWLRGCAVAQDGADATAHWHALLALAANLDAQPLVQSAWFEWSFAADAREVLARLPAVVNQAHALGLPGTARSLQWRLLARRLELSGPAALLAQEARALHAHVEQGLSAKCQPPQVWWTLAQAYGKAGLDSERAEALASAREWLRRALPSVPAAHRAAFENSAIWRRLMG